MRYSWQSYWGLPIAAGGFLGVVIVLVMEVLPPQMVLLRTGILAAALTVTFAVALSAYRYADEVILQTHKTAWFWGSMFALLIAGVTAMAAFVGAVPIPNVLGVPSLQPEAAFADGIVFLILVQAAGFVVFWAYHNLARRR